VKDSHHGDFARKGLVKDDMLLELDFAAAREQIFARLAQLRMGTEECP